MKKTIGCATTVSFPALGLKDLSAKIDTGARYAALHCHRYELSDDETLRIWPLEPTDDQFHDAPYETTNFRRFRIRSSNGEIEHRYLITTSMVLGDETYEANVTLTDRGTMRFPVLLGRDFLKDNFIVDVAIEPYDEEPSL